MSFTLPLERVRPGAANAAAQVGGKALGCALLVELSYEVPRAFVITTDAWRALLDHTGLRQQLASMCDPDGGLLQRGSEESIAARCAELQEALRSAALPEALERELREQQANLGGRLAVRSSATCEDAKTTSFAGVFHSALDVSDGDAFLNAARACWASAVSYEALTHACRYGLDPRQTAMAILVQDMVPADWSGALFTREPTGLDPDRALLACTRGVGEALMDGTESGGSIPLDAATGTLQTGQSLPSGLPSWVPGRLMEIGRRLEAVRGHPQDIEWALRGDRLHLLQTRPITTIEPRRQVSMMWTRELSEERFPKPISPLGWSILQLLLPANTRTLKRRFGLDAKNPGDVARTINHYVYSNQGFFAIPGSMRLNPLAQMRFFGDYFREVCDAAVQLPAAATSQNGFGPRWLLLSRFFRAFIFPHAREVERSWSNHLDDLLEEMDARHEVDPAQLTNRQGWRHKLDMLRVGLRYMEPDLAIYIVKMACKWILGKIGHTLHGRDDPDFLPGLTSGVENRTLNMNVELEQLYSVCRARPELHDPLRAGDDVAFLAALDDAPGSLATQAFAQFVARNGHNTTNWDMMQPTWGEDRTQILALLRPYSQVERRHGFRDHRQTQLARYHEAKARVVDGLRGSPWMIPFFEELLRVLHRFMAIDEEHHFYCSRLYKPLRRLLLVYGERFVAGGVLERPEDVFFLRIEEVRQVLTRSVPFPRRYQVAARKATFARALARRPPDRFCGQTPLRAKNAPPEDAPVDESALRGVGASPGVAVGLVRVVVEPSDAAAFQAGEVLVTASPNPVWTPLYAVAAGLVTATGSVLSHGLVSAREYHLPAVVGIPDVTRRLQTGQRVQVDGDTGTVSLEQS